MYSQAQYGAAGPQAYGSQGYAQSGYGYGQGYGCGQAYGQGYGYGGCDGGCYPGYGGYGAAAGTQPAAGAGAAAQAASFSQWAQARQAGHHQAAGATPAAGAHAAQAQAQAQAHAHQQQQMQQQQMYMQQMNGSSMSSAQAVPRYGEYGAAGGCCGAGSAAYRGFGGQMQQGGYDPSQDYSQQWNSMGCYGGPAAPAPAQAGCGAPTSVPATVTPAPAPATAGGTPAAASSAIRLSANAAEFVPGRSPAATSAVQMPPQQQAQQAQQPQQPQQLQAQTHTALHSSAQPWPQPSPGWQGGGCQAGGQAMPGGGQQAGMPGCGAGLAEALRHQFSAQQQQQHQDLQRQQQLQAQLVQQQQQAQQQRDMHALHQQQQQQQQQQLPPQHALPQWQQQQAQHGQQPAQAQQQMMQQRLPLQQPGAQPSAQTQVGHGLGMPPAQPQHGQTMGELASPAVAGAAGGFGQHAGPSKVEEQLVDLHRLIDGSHDSDPSSRSKAAADSQPAMGGWANNLGLAADGSADDRQRPAWAPRAQEESANEERGVFKAGVPISDVPDDGDWSIGPPPKVRDEGQVRPVDAVRGLGGDRIAALARSAQEVDMADVPPTVELKVAESFKPRGDGKHGEMAILVGEKVHAFETLAKNGWVYAFKYDEQDSQKVVAQGWIPLSMLVPLDLDLDAIEAEEKRKAQEDESSHNTKAARRKGGADGGKDAAKGEAPAGERRRKADEKADGKAESKGDSKGDKDGRKGKDKGKDKGGKGKGDYGRGKL
eukprot:TRINITY_DN2661_c2_g1_i1.p1 TRINITY_DN2661_c2_g1~~TRINITY_DN2661_c2_g1_i1.p1  ORF type:complete len:789 (-),score=257.57 TRINITY_DN2661_c2_g1_i1:195-2489(-)